MVESHPTRDSGRTFVGRQQEMVVLEEALDDAMTGQGRMVTLSGEPGIDKTSTARELSASAERRGARPLVIVLVFLAASGVSVRNNTSGESPDKYCINSCISFIFLSTAPGSTGVAWSY